MSAVQISRSAVVLQLATFIAVLLPHLGWLPVWIPLLALATAGGRLMIHTGRWSFPHWTVKLVLIIASVAGLIISFAGQTGPEAMVALLILGLALKLLEIYHRRDALILLYVALFVLATAFLFQESVWMAAYVLLALWLLLAGLVAIHQRPGQAALWPPFRRSLSLLLPAMPLMLVLFLLFPRLEPLWSIQLNTPRATTGLSDSMSPGSISELAQSDDLAFRVSFDGNPPPAPEQSYWRALVLSRFDGHSWRQASPWQQGRLPNERLTPEGAALSYEIMLEPGSRPWLVALDQPLAPGRGQRMTPFRTLVSPAPVERRIQYRLTSAPNFRLQPRLSMAEREHYLQLPARGNERSRTLARQWWQQSGGQAQEFIRQMMTHFNRSFVYTLTPGTLGRDSIDQFLFASRQGYCEHFAGASVFLLRAAGIPARVVTGYQGGEWNPYENYLQLHQYDAHAWAEVWLEGQGWTRLDPTAAVAPERIRLSAEQYFRQQGETALDGGRAFSADWVLRLQQRYDAFNFVWQRWVLNYQSRQNDLLRDWLGGLDYWRLILAVLLPLALVLAGVLGWPLLKALRRGHRDRLERRLERLQLRLGQVFGPRQRHQTLTAWLRTLAPRWPEQQETLEQLARLDEQRRYARQAEPECADRIQALTEQLLTALRERRK